MCRPIRVLLAVDDADHRRLLLRALSNEHILAEIFIGANKDEILRAAQCGDVDCFVLDFNLPPYKAMDLLRGLNRISRSTPVVVIYPGEEQEDVIQPRHRGRVEFVSKERAMQPWVLWERIDAAIARSRSKQQEYRKVHRRLRELQYLIQTDPSTGLSNRIEALRQLNVGRPRNDRCELTSVVMIDIDHFKGVNDTFGHAAGDKVLKVMAQILRSHTKLCEIPCRWGGEEFAIFMPSQNLSDAWIWAENVRRAIEEVEIEYGGQFLRVTASFGVTTVRTAELGDLTMTMANRAMDLSKKLGRNRICTAQMVKVIEIAQELQEKPDLTIRTRLEQLRERLADELGHTQLEHTGPHGEDVCRLSIALGREMQLAQQQIDQLDVAATFHDIGKVVIPEELLAAPRRLTSSEKRLIDEHARFGGEILRACGAQEEVVEAVARHHDDFASPMVVRRISGAETPRAPLWSIISVADAASTMVSNRNYAPRRTVEQAMLEIRRERGRQFDPIVVDTLARINTQVDRRLAA